MLAWCATWLIAPAGPEIYELNAKCTCTWSELLKKNVFQEPLEQKRFFISGRMGKDLTLEHGARQTECSVQSNQNAK